MSLLNLLGWVLLALPLIWLFVMFSKQDGWKITLVAFMVAAGFSLAIWIGLYLILI